MPFQRSLLSILTLIALTAAVLAGNGVRSGPMRPLHDALLALDDVMYDAALAARPVRPASGRVTIIAADQRSLEDPRLGRWPWPRSVHARLLDRLHAAGARAVVLDIGFVRPTSPAEDGALARALRRNGATAISTLSSFDAERGETVVRLPLPSFMEAARAVGFNVLEGVPVRATSLRERDEPLTSFNALLVEALLMLEGLDPNRPPVIDPDATAMQVGSRSLPVRGHALRIDFRAQAPPTISYVDALYAPLPDLHDRAVVVAATFDPKDVFEVPCTARGRGGRMAGGAILAQSIDGALTGGTIADVTTAWAWLWVFLLESVAVAIGLRVRRPAVGWILVAAVPAVAIGTEFAAMIYARTWIAVLAPVVAAKLAFALLYVSNLRGVRAALARFVPSRVEDELSRRGTLTSGEFEASILFQDIKDYTTLSERLAPDRIMELLNEFYGSQQAVIKKHQGIVVDFQGDAQMVMFGGDGKERNHARLAVDAAWQILQELSGAGRQGLARLGGEAEEVSFGIGIATGTVSVGGLGGQERRQFSALGDTTNVAARLQSLTREMGCPLVVSEETWAAVADGYVGEAVRDVRLKGKTVPVTVYKIVGVRKDGPK